MLSKWFIPPSKPVEIRLLGDPGPLFPHARFVRDQLDPLKRLRLVGIIREEGKGQENGEDQSRNQ